MRKKEDTVCRSLIDAGLRPLTLCSRNSVGNKKYLNMKHLETAIVGAAIAGKLHSRWDLQSFLRITLDTTGKITTKNPQASKTKIGLRTFLSIRLSPLPINGVIHSTIIGLAGTERLLCGGLFCYIWQSASGGCAAFSVSFIHLSKQWCSSALIGKWAVLQLRTVRRTTAAHVAVYRVSR